MSKNSPFKHISIEHEDTLKQNSKLSAYDKLAMEHEALWDNIERLQAIRDKKQPDDVSDYQWSLLKKQLKAMRKYNKILAARSEDLYIKEYDALLHDRYKNGNNYKNSSNEFFHDALHECRRNDFIISKSAIVLN